MNYIERHPHIKGCYIGYFATGSVRIYRGGAGWRTVNQHNRSDYSALTARTLAALDVLIGQKHHGQR